jgi:hypothetical protein
MNPQIEVLFSAFKKRIALFNLEDVMYVVWGLMGNLQFDKPIPSDIETRRDYDQTGDINKRRLAGINEWELEFILSQALTYSPSYITTGFSPTKISQIGPLVNDLRKFEDEVHKLIFTDNSLIQREFFRVAHRQFPWQIPLNTQSTYRYFRVFNDGDLKSIVTKAIGLTPLEIYQIGLALLGLLISNFTLSLRAVAAGGFTSSDKIGIFVYTFGIDIRTIQKQLRDSVQMDETLVYGYNPLRAKPILIQDDTLYCPMPTLLLWQITSGIYYHVMKAEGFNNAFGNAFQNYVGFVINEVMANNALFTIYPEATFGKPEKRTIDWAIEDNEAYLMIECKGKRLTLSAKSEILDATAIESDIEKMCSFVIQGYKTISDFKGGLYPHMKYDSRKKIHLVVLTLEEWFIPLNPELMLTLFSKVTATLREKGMDENMPIEIPFFVESMSSFEKAIQVIESIGITGFSDAMQNNSLVEQLEKIEQRDILTKYFDSEIIAPLGL